MSPASLVAWTLVGSATSGMLFLLPRTLLLTDWLGRRDFSSLASLVAPFATEMLSRATCATGEAFDLHDPPVYQLVGLEADAVFDAVASAGGGLLGALSACCCVSWAGGP